MIQKFHPSRKGREKSVAQRKTERVRSGLPHMDIVAQLVTKCVSIEGRVMGKSIPFLSWPDDPGSGLP